MVDHDIQLLYEYDRWANDRVFRAVSALTQEEFTRDLGGSFRSMRDTLVHIVASEWAWLTFWMQPFPSSAFLEDLWVREEALFAPGAFPDVAAVQLKWTEIKKQLAEFANQITNELLARMFPVRGTEVSLGHLMQHLANHSTYHRGQVSLMMRQIGAEPLATDFGLFLLEGRSEKRGSTVTEGR